MTQTYLEVHNLCKTFTAKNGSVEALKGVSLSIGKGEIFGVIGLSGAGKSTLVRCMNLLERPDSGDVLLNGESLLKLSKEQLRLRRQKIGMIFQHFNLLEQQTVLENVCFPLEIRGIPRKERREKALELLGKVGLADKANAYPAQLSGGQKQRVAIARVLANEPEVILCDEATSALDPETTQTILKLLKNIRDTLGITIVVITHELDVVKGICDRIAVMDGGRVVEQGETYEVFSNPQSEMLRGLVRHSQNFALPSGAFEQNGSIIKLTYAGENATEPVLFDAGKLFDVRLSILHGKIEYINEKPFGILYVRAEGANDQIDRATAHLRGQVEHLEVLKHAG